jgi:hypothetical protein
MDSDHCCEVRQMERRSLLKTAMMSVPLMAAQYFKADEAANVPEIEITMPKGLRQEVWEIAKEPGRLSRLCPEARSCEEDECIFYAYAFYVEHGNHIIMMDWLCSEEEMVVPRITFQELITRLAPRTWKDLMFGLELYKMVIIEWTTPECSAKKDPFWSDPLGNWPKFRPNKVVDALLAGSRGAVLWAEQLHSLYILCDPDRGAAIRFRKALHAAKIEACERLRDLHFADGISLEEVINERMVFGHTRHPDYRAFALLAEHFVQRPLSAERPLM